MATPKKKASAKSSMPSRKPAQAREIETEEMDSEEEGEVEAFDYAAFFAEGGFKYTEEDMRDVGALMPIYASEHAFEEQWPPLFGSLVNRIELKVAKDEAEEDKQYRHFYVVEAKIATKALAGTGDDREVIDIEPGEYLLMPESGALKNKDRLKMAAVDPDVMHNAIFRVVGQLDLKKAGRNPMWEIDANLVGEPVSRKGRYALSNTSRSRELAQGSNGAAAQLPPGSVVNSRTGQPAGSLVNS